MPTLSLAAIAALVASIIFSPTKKAREVNWRKNQFTSIACLSISAAVGAI
jgi:hypothetical protein